MVSLLFLFLLCVLVAFPILFISSVPISVASRTITVPDDFFKIQEAVDAANIGDIVYIKSGKYYENIVINNSNITLKGENMENTILDGDISGNILTIIANNITIEGFTIINRYGYGVFSEINNKFLNIKNNIITKCVHGIEIGGYNNSIYGNKIFNCLYAIKCFGLYNSSIENNYIFNITGDYAIYVSGFNNMIINNTISQYSVGGIAIYGYKTIDAHNTIQYNNISVGRGMIINSEHNFIKYNLFYGITESCTSIGADENIIDGNIYIGLKESMTSSIYLASKKNRFTNNIIIDCDYPLHLSELSDENTIVKNTFNNYINQSIYISNSINNRIYNNNFFNTKIYCLKDSFSLWNDSYPLGGNYWSSYSNIDNFYGLNQDIPGTDGIWDKPYKIDDNNIDFYPLVKPIDTDDNLPDVNLKVTIFDEKNEYIIGTNVSLKHIIWDRLNFNDTSNKEGSVKYNTKIGVYLINISKNGYETYSKTIVLFRPETNVKIFLLRKQSGLLIVSARDKEGGAIIGASVKSISQPSGQLPLNGTINSDGLITFSDVMSGNYSFQVSKRGYISKTVSINAKVGETAEISITLYKETVAPMEEPTPKVTPSEEPVTPSEEPTTKIFPTFSIESFLIGLSLGIIPFIGMILLWIVKRR